MTSAPTLSARLFKLGTGLFLMAAGLGGTALLFIPYRKALLTRSWTETPCQVVKSYRDEQRMSDFAEPVQRVFIHYHYTFHGSAYTGTRLRLGAFFSQEDQEVAKKTPHPKEAQKLLEKYPEGLATVCWVNPAAPAEAVLEHHTKAAIYTLWWPLLFAAGGAGMAWSALRTARRKNLTSSPGPNAPADSSAHTG